jgi:integrase
MKKMGRARKKFPVARYRFRGSGCRIYWSFQRKVYEASAGELTEDEASICVDRANLALRDAGEWPVEIADAPAVRNYQVAIGKVRLVGHDADEILSAYGEILEGEPLSQDWRNDCKSMLKRFAEKHPKLERVTHVEALNYISGIGKTHSVDRRNHYLNTLKKFYRWLCKVHGIRENPFMGIPTTKAKRKASRGGIAYYTKTERNALLKLADKLHYGHMIWVGFYAGLRRGELWRVHWEDIHWESETLIVPETKTSTPRTIPLPDVLMKKLKRIKKKCGPLWDAGKKPCVVPKITRDAPGAFDGKARYMMERLAASADKTKSEKDNALGKALSKVDVKTKFYNTMRHSYCTHLVQAGVPLDVVAAWAGHDPKTCREYYANFVPKELKNKAVNLL